MRWTLALAVLLGAISFASPAFAGGTTTYPKNCLDVMIKLVGTVDGDYVIEPEPGQVFTVYCRGMSSNIGNLPEEYLTLASTVAGNEVNFSSWGSISHANYCLLKTSFTKVRIDPSTLLVDIGDLTYATTTGINCLWGEEITGVAFGVAAEVACGAAYWAVGNCLVTAANIDLTGTPFALRSTFIGFGTPDVPRSYVELADGEIIEVPYAPGWSVPNFDNPLVVSSKAVTVHVSGNAGPYGFRSGVTNQWIHPSPGMLALKLVYEP